MKNRNRKSPHVHVIDGAWIKDIIMKKLKKDVGKLKGFFHEIGSAIRFYQRKFIKAGIILLVSFLIILLLNIISDSIAANVPDQTSCFVWGGEDYAQISCYTSRINGFTVDELMRFEHDLNQTLKSSGEENEASLWTDAYSGRGVLTVTNRNTSVEGTAYGVGNNFFVFHPLQLLNGSYIDTKNVMKDYILLDEEAAWRLFGSSDVAGMYVYINGEPHVVSGVYRRPEGRLNTASGNGEITFYISYEALMKYNRNAAITSYEVIMENPVKQYAYNYVKNYFQPDDSMQENAAAFADEVNREIKIIENSDRYSIKNKWEILKNFGIYSMKLDEIIYPFWENIAAAYGSIVALLFFVQILGGIVIFLCAAGMLVRIHRFRKRKIE